jgi:hypothetical protein
VERIVGLFDAERASGAHWSADEFGANAGRTVTDDELRWIRELRAELFAKWAAVAPGDALELELALASYAETTSSRPI